MTDLVDFLFPAPARRSTGAILAWWERRRLAYNVWVGVPGLVSLATVTLYNAAAGGEPAFPAVLVPVAVFGVMANVCYLLGPAIEILLHRLWGSEVLPVGPALFRMGLTFSVGLALLPTLVTMMIVVVRMALAIVGVG